MASEETPKRYRLNWYLKSQYSRELTYAQVAQIAEQLGVGPDPDNDEIAGLSEGILDALFSVLCDGEWEATEILTELAQPLYCIEVSEIEVADLDFAEVSQ